MKLDDTQALQQTIACALIALFRTHHAPRTLERTFRNVRSEVATNVDQEMLSELPGAKPLLDAFEAALRENKKEKRSHA
ncbi:hypothetical protein AB4059_00620 [Lysobacter sp. 2RAF19]